MISNVAAKHYPGDRLMRKWKCTVCGYIHIGDEPPEICPVCGADRSKFIEITTKDVPVSDGRDQKQSPQVTTSEKALNSSQSFADLVFKLHIHPIAVHVPNGLLPVSVFFSFLSVLLGIKGLETAAHYNMIFVLLTMPIVLFSGYIDWNNRYQRAVTQVFVIKITCGAVVTLMALILVLWRFMDPNIAAVSSAARGLFLFLHLIMLAAAAIAGFYGGKLVFKENKSLSLSKN